MNKALLVSVLAASMFASTASADKLTASGPKAISGWGCAVAKGTTEREVTLGPEDGIRHKGLIKEGTIITRKVTFKYDFSKSVECGGKHVWINLKSKNKEEKGVKLISGNIDLKFNLGRSAKGHETVVVKYKVLSPGAWKLTSKFHYKHAFKMIAKVD